MKYPEKKKWFLTESNISKKNKYIYIYCSSIETLHTVTHNMYVHILWEEIQKKNKAKIKNDNKKSK